MALLPPRLPSSLSSRLSSGLSPVVAYRPSDRAVRLACLAALVANTVIVVTGGAVRLTGSGLGCPSWPGCTDRSLVPTSALGVHGAIEFGNRMLTYVVSVAVGAAIIATMLRRPRRRALVRLAWSLFAGVVAQAVIGGVTVRTGLNPVTVMAHFLVSMLLIAASVLLYERSGQSDARPRPVVRRELWILGRLLLAVVAATLVFGTVVTGSGPHSGDRNATHRLPIAPATATQLHADFVFLLFGLAISLLLALRATGAPQRVRSAVRDLLVIGAAQGLIGYVQYFTKLPVVLVGAHVLGACLVWIAALRVYLAMSERDPVAKPVFQRSAATVAGGLR